MTYFLWMPGKKRYGTRIRARSLEKAKRAFMVRHRVSQEDAHLIQHTGGGFDG